MSACRIPLRRQKMQLSYNTTNGPSLVDCADMFPDCRKDMSYLNSQAIKPDSLIWGEHSQSTLLQIRRVARPARSPFYSRQTQRVSWLLLVFGFAALWVPAFSMIYSSNMPTIRLPCWSHMSFRSFAQSTTTTNPCDRKLSDKTATKAFIKPEGMTFSQTTSSFNPLFKVVDALKTSWAITQTIWSSWKRRGSEGCLARPVSINALHDLYFESRGAQKFILRVKPMWHCQVLFVSIVRQSSLDEKACLYSCTMRGEARKLIITAFIPSPPTISSQVLSMCNQRQYDSRLVVINKQRLSSSGCLRFTLVVILPIITPRCTPYVIDRSCIGRLICIKDFTHRGWT